MLFHVPIILVNKLKSDLLETREKALAQGFNIIEVARVIAKVQYLELRKVGLPKWPEAVLAIFHIGHIQLNEVWGIEELYKTDVCHISTVAEDREGEYLKPGELDVSEVIVAPEVAEVDGGPGVGDHAPKEVFDSDLVHLIVNQAPELNLLPLRCLVEESLECRHLFPTF